MPPLSGGKDVLGHRAEAGPLLTPVYLAAHPHVGGIRQVDEEPSREGNLGGQPRPLVADGLLCHLDQDRVALLDQFLDGLDLARTAPTAPAVACVPVRPLLLVFVDREIGGVEKTSLIGADVDEGGLNAREDGVDFTEVDVPDQSHLIGAVEHELDEAVLFEQRYPRLMAGSRNQNFTLQETLSKSSVTPRPSTLGPPQVRSPAGAWERTLTAPERS